MLPGPESEPQQLDFSAGAQQAVRSTGVQQADCEVVPSPGAGTTVVPVGRGTLALLEVGSSGGRDESADMDEPPVVFAEFDDERSAHRGPSKRDGDVRERTQPEVR